MLPLLVADTATILAWATAISTGALVILTTGYVYATFQWLRAQSQPQIVVYPFSLGRFNPLVFIAIENAGYGVAKDIRFEVTPPLVQQESPTSSASNIVEMLDGPLVKGIAALGNKQRVNVWFATASAIRQGTIPGSFKITCSYEIPRSSCVKRFCSRFCKRYLRKSESFELIPRQFNDDAESIFKEFENYKTRQAVFPSH